MSHKRILYLVNVDWFFVSHRLPIAVEAIQNGYEVHIACAVTDQRDYLSRLGILVHEVSFSRSGTGLLNELNTVMQIYKLVKKVKPDMIHSVTIKPVLYGGLVACLARVPAMVAAVSGLGLVFVAEDLKTKLTKSVATLLYKLAFSHKNMKVIFQNPSDKQSLVSAIKLREDKIEMIKGSGADLDQYVYLPEPNGPCIVVMASRLLKEKGVYHFIEAANILKEKNVSVEFWLVGDPDPGNPNSVTEQELNDWKEQGVVKILGFRADISNVFSKASMVVLPSFYGEGLPKVLIEAAACGRPIITTDNPGCREAVIDGETGVIVPAKNTNKLIDAIEKLASDKAKRMEMGERARIYAETEFDVNAVVQKHLEIYRKLIEAP